MPAMPVMSRLPRYRRGRSTVRSSIAREIRIRTARDATPADQAIVVLGGSGLAVLVAVVGGIIIWS